jgi:hypothetical protein
MSKIDIIIDALSVAQNSVWSALNEQALAAARELQAEKQEPEQKPVSTNDHLCAMLRQVHDVLACTALPMKRKWYGLTAEEIHNCWQSAVDENGFTKRKVYDAIEAKLKEKNT